MLNIVQKLFKTLFDLDLNHIPEIDGTEFKKNGLKNFLLSADFYSSWQSSDLLNFVPDMSEKVKALDDIQIQKENDRMFESGNFSSFSRQQGRLNVQQEITEIEDFVSEPEEYINWQQRIFLLLLITVSINIGFALFKIFREKTFQFKCDVLICQAKILCGLLLILAVYSFIVFKFTHHPMGNKEFTTSWILLIWSWICNLGLHNEIQVDFRKKVPRELVDVR